MLGKKIGRVNEKICGKSGILSAKTAAILFFFFGGKQVKYLYSAMGT